MRATAEDVARRNAPGLGHAGARLREAVDSLERATTWLLAALKDGRSSEALAGATAYLRLFGLAQGGTALARKALASLDAGAEGRDHAARLVSARFFAEHHATDAPGLERAIVEGAGALEDAAALFAA
jgi:acyl-CoA dehydrogenase